MKLWLFSVLFATAIVAKGLALECYICDNCGELNESDHQRQQCTLDNVFPRDPVLPTTEIPETTTETATEEPETTTTTTTTTTLPPSTPPPTTPPPTTQNPITTPPVSSDVTTPSTLPPGPPTTTGAPITPAAKTGMQLATDHEFRCFIHTVNDKTGRGCTRWTGAEQDTCEAVGGTHCHICNENGCNSAASLVTSFFVVFAGVVVMALRLF